ncbi:MAG: lamin tail domain-containing protein [Myxococcaceae bacterium]|nr:lamin tail domain-containing protein [Myxococcaceae bacterium]
MRTPLLTLVPALILLAGCPAKVKPPPPPPPAPEIVSFTASAASVLPGEKVTLSWETRNATTVELRDSVKGVVSGVDPSATSGELEVTLNGDQLFVLTAKNERGVRATAAVVITANTGAGKVLFVASPKQLRAGESAVLAWSAPRAKEVTLATAEGEAIDLKGQLTSGTVQVTPVTTTEYVLTVDGTVYTSQVTVAPSIDVLVGTPNPVQPGDTLTVSWKTTGAASVTLTAAVEGTLHEETDPAKAADGSFDIEVPASIDRGAVLAYELVATGADGSTSSQPLQIYVGGTVGVTSFTAPPLVTAGGSFQVSWTTSGADRVEIYAGTTRVYSNPSPATAASGTAVLPSPPQTTEYILRAYDARQTMAASDPVTVEPIGAPTVTTFTATPSTITYAGQPVTLAWTAPNARGVRIVPLGSTSAVYEGTGVASETGMVVVYPGRDTQYRLIVDNGIGASDLAFVDITVANPAAFTVTPPIAPLGSPVTVTGHNVVTAVGVSGFDEFIDISSTGTDIAYCSSCTLTTKVVTMPQTFTTTLFGQTVSNNKIAISINGWFTFGTSSVTWDSPLTLPTDKLEPFSIVPFYDDFYSASAGKIYYQLDQLGPDQRLIVQWKNVQYYPVSGSSLSFEAQVFSNGKVVFAYDNFSGYTGTAPVRGVINGDETVAEVVPGIPQPHSSVSLFAGPAQLPATVYASKAGIHGKVHLANGETIDIQQPYPYERVQFSEVNANPPAGVTDGQWIELENRSLQPLDLSGMTLDFGNGNTHTIATGTIVPPQAWFVLGQSSTAGDGVAVDYVYGNTFTIPPGGTVTLRNGTTTVTSITLPQVSLPQGTSWQMGDLPYLATSAGVDQLGCTARAANAYGTHNQHGTPGAANPECPGYAMTGSIAPNFESIAATGTKVMFDNTDDDIATITLPSPVILDGVAFNQLVVSTNGYISLDPTFTCSDQYCFSTPKKALDPTKAPVGLIAPFWADIDTTAHGGVYWERKVPGVTPNDGYTVVSWENVHRFDEPTDDLSFQVKFFDNGNIEFHFGTFNGEDGTRSVTWVEHASGDAAFIFNIDSADTPGIASNRAFRLTAQ